MYKEWSLEHIETCEHCLAIQEGTLTEDRKWELMNEHVVAVYSDLVDQVYEDIKGGA